MARNPAAAAAAAAAVALLLLLLLQVVQVCGAAGVHDEPVLLVSVADAAEQAWTWARAHTLAQPDVVLVAEHFALLALVGWLALRVLRALLRASTWYALAGVLIRVLRRTPGVGAVIAREQDKALQSIRSMVLKSTSDAGTRRFTALPQSGLSPQEVAEILETMKQREVQFAKGRAFGGIYHYAEEHDTVLMNAFRRFSSTNALYPAVFPGLKKFESEVLAMCVSLFHGGPDACGTMTTGGTESLIMALKTYREYAHAKRGITAPELVMCESAHPALCKGAKYLGVKLVIVPMNERFEMDLNALRKAITRNTVMVVASAPQFAHGVLDPVEEIAAIASARGVPVHVDACLGGFYLPFLAKLGKLARKFDFAVPGVTSMSADLHKYGSVYKGASLVLYRTQELRSYQYFTYTDWPGGLYCSPSFSGSRSGGVIASAWAALVHFGEKGFLDMIGAIHKGFERVVEAVRAIDGLELVGEPTACAVAFRSKVFDVLVLADMMEKLGWEVPRMQRPACVHIVLGTRQLAGLDQYIQDLAECARKLRKDPKPVEGGSASVYGMAGRLPDRTLIGGILTGYLDALLAVPSASDEHTDSHSSEAETVLAGTVSGGSTVRNDHRPRARAAASAGASASAAKVGASPVAAAAAAAAAAAVDNGTPRRSTRARVRRTAGDE